MTGRIVLVAIPPVATLAGPLLPGVSAPGLWLGLPRLLVWTLAWAIVATTAVLLVIDRRDRGAGEEEPA